MVLDAFLAWFQAFMIQVALAARSGRGLVIPLLCAFFFFFIMLRGVKPLRIARFWKVLSGVPVFLGAFYILLYLSLSRVKVKPDDLQTPLTIMSFISAVVLLWALLLLGRDLCLAGRALFRRVRHDAGRRVGRGSGHSDGSPQAEEERASRPDAAAPADPTRRKFLLDGGLLLAAGVMGGIGARSALGAPEVTPVDITLPRLPAALDGLRIVQLSDLHVSAVLTHDWVRDVVERANALRPDLLVLTGDLVDGYPHERLKDMVPLSGLQARHGVYACTGNHDFYSGLDAWLPRFRDLGLTALRNEHAVLRVNGAPLVLVGVHDLAERAAGQGPDMARALEGAPDDAFRILLEHQPQRAPDREGLVDLQLSGHTHGGQIPLIRPLVRRTNNGFVAGNYDVGSLRLYVNRGTGIWGGLPLRLGIPSEITLITLRRENASVV